MIASESSGARLRVSGHAQWVALFAALVIGGDRAATAQAPSRPNIVLVLTDDLGINDLGCYGRTEHATPRLDRLAAEGVRFTSTYCAQPICSASRAAILTGRAPARLGLTTFLPGRGDAASQKLLQAECLPSLPPEETTLGEVFQAAGYDTCYLGKWHLGSGASGPQNQGFRETDFVDRVPQPPHTKGEAELTTRAVDFLKRRHKAPFLLIVSHSSPHIPLEATEDEQARFAACFNPAYAAMLARLDAAVGQLLDALREQRLDRNTVVIFTSDNGGLHVPEGRDAPPTHNTPFRAGKGFLYEGGLRIPLIVSWPERLPAGAVIDAPIINTDLLPTLCRLAAIDAPANLDGQSFATLLDGEPEPSERTFFWHFPHYTNQGSRPAGAVRRGKWKLIEDYESGSAVLYDLNADPDEALQSTDHAPETADELLALLRQWRRDVGARENRPNPSFDAKAHRRIYRDVDVSRLRRKGNAAEIKERLAPWREAIDAAVK